MYPDSQVHGANMGPTWGRQDPGRPHVGHMKIAIWVELSCLILYSPEPTKDETVELPVIIKLMYYLQIGHLSHRRQSWVSTLLGSVVRGPATFEIQHLHKPYSSGIDWDVYWAVSL